MPGFGIEYDDNKRLKTLEERGIDFADAPQVFAGDVLSQIDDRHDYAEERVVSIGMLGDDVVVVVWTLRGETRRIISMRKGNEREKAIYRHNVARS